MKKDFIIPQGKYRIGRDIPEGIYLIAAINDLSFVTVHGEGDKYEHYTLNDENTMMCHTELEKGDTMSIDGSVKIRLITKFISEDNDFDLLTEIEDFQQSLKISENAKDVQLTENDPQVESSPKTVKKGFKRALGESLVTSFHTNVSSSNSSKGMHFSTPSKKRSNGRCNGDCANCPPHYGYRYGRWYYGHDHIEGCEFGGNKGSGSRD